MLFRKPVPWTHILANIATEHPAVHLLLEFAWDFIAQLNREVRNTLGGIQKIAFGRYSLGRASIDATPTSAAMVADGIVVKHWQIANYFCEEEKRAAFWVYGQGVAAIPANASTLRPFAFHDWCGINKTAPVYFANFSLDEAQQ